MVGDPERSRLERAAPAAVFATAVLLFADTARNGFAHDDGPIILRNPFLLDPGNLLRFFSMDYWYPTWASGLYRPVATASYALNAAAGGLDPFGFHLVNIVLHGAVAALVLLLVRRLTGDAPLSAATAFLFAAHAVHTEVVANVANGRPELLAALFLLLSLLAHLARERAVPGRRSWLRAASVASFALALLSKESAVALIGVIYLTDVVYGDGSERLSPARPWQVLRERFGPVYLVYLLAVPAYIGVRFLALGVEQSLPPSQLVDNPLVELDLGWRIVNALQIVLRYGALLVLPLQLAYDYSFDQIPLILSASDPRFALVLALSLGGVALLVVAYRRSRELFYGLAFSAISLSPVANLVLPIGTIMAERLLYTPSIGFCLVLALALRRLAGPLARSEHGRARAFAALAIVVVALHGLRAFDRSGDWRSEDTIWMHDLGVSPRSARVQSNAGAVLERNGRCDEALEHFDAAIALGISPHQFVNPYQGKVVCLTRLGRYREARELYEVVIPYGPRNPEIERQIQQGLRGGGAPR